MCTFIKMHQAEVSRPLPSESSVAVLDAPVLALELASPCYKVTV